MGDFVISVLNYIISAIGGAISFLIGFLPKSPFHYLEVNSVVNKYLGYLNWIVPINYIVTFLEVWLIAIGVFYIYQVFARWVKVIA